MLARAAEAARRGACALWPSLVEGRSLNVSFQRKGRRVLRSSDCPVVIAGAERKAGAVVLLLLAADHELQLEGRPTRATAAGSRARSTSGSRAPARASPPRPPGDKRYRSIRRRLGAGWRQHRAAAGQCSRRRLTFKSNCARGGDPSPLLADAGGVGEAGQDM